MYTISHHGAAQGVTGSCHRLSLANGHSLLVDCGLFQGKDDQRRHAAGHSSQIDFDLDSVRALLVTHCHLDHVGRIPWLLAAGFTGPIYATEATAELLPLVIEDAVKVGVSKDSELIQAVMYRLKKQLVACPYNQRIELPELSGNGLDTCVYFQVAGHILGSAYLEIDVTDVGSASTKRILFSGDLGSRSSPLLPDYRLPTHADVVVLESTYGDRLHDNRQQRQQRLKQVLQRCLENTGAVLIPAFSIGRTQELLYELEDIFFQLKSDQSLQSKKTGLSSSIDVVVDSPLAAQFTRHYRKLADFWDQEARERKQQGRHPLAFEQLLTINSHKDHGAVVGYLRRTGKPAIVIAASGMCAGGRIVNYLEQLLGDERTDVLLVGYQAYGTPGRDIQEWGPRGGYVVLNQRRVEIRANVETLSGYSAHADQNDLVAFVASMETSPAKIILTHGEPHAQWELTRLLQSELPETQIALAVESGL
ncbi:MBL fold metallo-hydrolase RNA specificity domain-containing protein [Oceanobacter mangrovi]|uniref:MBL fold metallo-hydrolase RNA specificity domain-containing protein n=1 Tax=Oceanobacter mangrovi TaxID=2862510 RepID=UPI001C8D5734|nr:MBL fold metallo-hydrolase [Oceanobacter mangrovi]